MNASTTADVALVPLTLSALAALWIAAMHLRMWWTGPRIEKPPTKEWR